MNKWYCIKISSFSTAKEILTRLKRLPTEWEKKIFVSYSSDKGLISQIYREHNQLKPQKVIIPMTKKPHELKREFSKELVQMAT
jgi:hypothetical protein